MSKILVRKKNCWKELKIDGKSKIGSALAYLKSIEILNLYMEALLN